MQGNDDRTTPDADSAPTGDPNVELVPTDADEFAAFAGVFRDALSPFAEADVEKARIGLEQHKTTVGAEERIMSKRLDQAHSRFFLVFIVGTVFALALLGLAAMLIQQGQIMFGVMIVSHMVTLAVGLLGGRSLHKRHDDSAE